MGIEQLYTAQVSNNPARGNPANVTALSAKNLQGVLANGNFFDMFLAHLVEAREKAGDKPNEDKPLTSDAPVLKETTNEADELTEAQDPGTVVESTIDNALELNTEENLEITSENGEIINEENTTVTSDSEVTSNTQVDEETPPISDDPIENEINQALFLNARIFKHLLKSAIHDIAPNTDIPGKNPVADKFFNYLSNNEEEKEFVFANAFNLLIENIGEDMELPDFDSPETLVLNLTPQELTDLKGHINDLINSYAETQNTPNQQGLIASLRALLIGNGPENTESMDSRYLNGKSVKGKDFHDHMADASQSNVDTLEELKAASEAKTKTGDLVKQKDQTIEYKHVSSDVISAIDDFDGLVKTVIDASTATAPTLSSPHGLQNIASNIIQVSHAAELHPASHMVAMQVQKASQDGKDKTFTVQLDPPDLGRIKVEMEFSHKSKTMKTILTIEKPETYAMLQRDAHALERSLQDMGIDMDSNIGFELSQNDNDFMGDNQRGGGHDHSGAHGAGDNAFGQEDHIEEVSLMWLIDPETGHTRYDLWA